MTTSPSEPVETAPPNLSARETPPIDLSATKSSPQKLRDVMAEVRRVGATDPAAQAALLEDLERSDPAIWPLVVQQFRATRAYRQRRAENPGDRDYAQRLPPVAPGSEIARQQAEDGAAKPASANPVQPASYGSPIAQDWRQQLACAIKLLEDETPWSPTTPAELAQQVRLRMLYTVAGRYEDAAKPIPGMTPAAEQFQTWQLSALTTWLDAERLPEPERRAAAIQPILAESLARLSELAPLTLRNTTFCTEIRSYGSLNRVEKPEFLPDQEVLLYTEVENFTSAATSKGYQTSLRSTYEIIDSRGERAAEYSFPPTEEVCQNRRRDFFVGHRLRLPKKLPAGAYTLQLLIQDMKSQKSGQSSIPFTVKSKEPEGAAGKPT